MKIIRDRQKLALLPLAFTGALMIIAVIQLMRHVETLLESDLRISLTEIVSQNKEAIASRLALNIKSVEGTARRIGEELEHRLQSQTEEDARDFIRAYGLEHNDENQFVADDLGIAAYKDIRTIDISGRKYFRTSKRGESNISESIISRIDGEEIFVISAPIHSGGKFIGTFQHVLTHDEIYKVLLPPLFSSSGYIYIIKDDGYVVVHNSQESSRSNQSDNYFRDLYANGNREAADRMESDARAGKSGFTETYISGQKMFSVYEPIDKARGWFLVVTVPVLTVFPNGEVVVNLFYSVLSLVVLIAVICVAYFLRYKARQERRLMESAFVDSVTDGATYAKFLSDTKSAFDSSHDAFSIVKADVDNFKYINKFHGFEFGNQVLRHIYRHIQAHIAPDECVARIANDDFVLLLKDAKQQRLDALFNPLTHKNIIIYFSAGVFVVENKNEDVNIMIDKARIAAESIKGLAHIPYAFYSSELDLLSAHNEGLKQRITSAIEKREFVPFYQPKVDITNSAVVGCEALARWQTAEGVFISPGDFIPVCEQTGLILTLDMVIYEKSLAFLRGRLDEKSPCVPVSVNFSTMHLHDRSFPELIHGKATEYQVPPNLIQIEITESAFLNNFGEMVDSLGRLRDYGFLVAMDDFGSGYSSLNMLGKMPVDILKIDKEFLNESSGNEKRDAIFAGVVDIARNIGLHVVVEGVETIRDVNLMAKCGCRVAQGYFFAKPVPEGEFTLLLNGGHVTREPVMGTL